MHRIVFLIAVSLAAAPRQPVKLAIAPQNPLLFGKGSTQRLNVTVEYSDGTVEDVTAAASFQSGKTDIASVNADGLLTAAANGGAPIKASWKALTATTTALVQRAESPLASSFAGDILPILTKYGCNGGSCHGALNGQNGFKLSLFGYEPDSDYEMIVHKHDGRRVSLTDPEHSLL